MATVISRGFALNVPIIGCIYRHPTMNLNEFNDNYLNLLKYDKHPGTNEFIDSLSSCMYLPYILHPTRVTGH